MKIPTIIAILGILTVILVFIGSVIQFFVINIYSIAYFGFTVPALWILISSFCCYKEIKSPQPTRKNLMPVSINRKSEPSTILIFMGALISGLSLLIHVLIDQDFSSDIMIGSTFLVSSGIPSIIGGVIYIIDKKAKRSILRSK